MQHYKQDYYYFSQQFDVSMLSRKCLRQARTHLILYPGMCSGRWFHYKWCHLGGLNQVTPLSSSSAKAFATPLEPCGHRPCFQVCSLANLSATPESKLGVCGQSTCSQQKCSKVVLCLLGPALTLQTSVFCLAHPGLCFPMFLPLGCDFPM